MKPDRAFRPLRRASAGTRAVPFATALKIALWAALCAVLISAPVRAQETAAPPGVAETPVSSMDQALAAADAALLPQMVRDYIDNPQWERWTAEAERAQTILQSGRASSAALDDVRETLEAQRRTAASVSAEAEAAATRVETQLEALGPAPEDGASEPPEIASARAELTNAAAAARSVQRRADRVVVRAQGLLTDLTATAQRNLFSALTSRNPSPANPANWVEGVGAIDAVGARALREVERTLESPAERVRLADQAPAFLLIVVLCLAVLFGLRRIILSVLTRIAANAQRGSRRVLVGVGVALTRYISILAAIILFLAALSEVEILGPVGVATLDGFSAGLFYMAPAYAFGAAIFAPSTPSLRVAAVDDAGARAGFRAVMLLGVAMVMAKTATGVFEFLDAAPAAQSMLTLVFIAVGALALWRLASVGTTEASFWLTGKRLLVFVAGLTFLLALIGYDFAARALFIPSVDTLNVFAAAYLIHRVASELVDIRIGEKGEEGGQRLRLIPVAVGFALLCVATPLVALIWGAKLVDLQNAYDALASGLKIGEIRISPVDFIYFAVVFGVGYLLTGALKRVLAASVLPQAGVGSGAADAIVSGVGYVGVILAALAAIAATGLDLSNLAIVAGALSVGIGFGLQTIVSNFVSGVILLVERPIKVGDWIEVGGVHGTVKKVNVRSTEIETFDRSSYILPNSDLISGAVTNYTHTNTTGRVIITVGVAYGSDTRLVERLLLEAARDHPMLLSSPPPAAYFMNFGADALEFELRGYLRDVNWILSVRSDLNFKIEEKLRNAGLEIPYAQRDLYLRNADEVAKAFKGGPKATDA